MVSGGKYGGAASGRSEAVKALCNAAQLPPEDDGVIGSLDAKYPGSRVILARSFPVASHQWCVRVRRRLQLRGQLRHHTEFLRAVDTECLSHGLDLMSTRTGGPLFSAPVDG